MTKLWQNVSFFVLSRSQCLFVFESFQLTFELERNPPRFSNCTPLPPLWSSSTRHPGNGALISTLHTFFPSSSRFSSQCLLLAAAGTTPVAQTTSTKVVLTTELERPTSVWLLFKSAYAIEQHEEKIWTGQIMYIIHPCNDVSTLHVMRGDFFPFLWHLSSVSLGQQLLQLLCSFFHDLWSLFYFNSMSPFTSVKGKNDRKKESKREKGRKTCSHWTIQCKYNFSSRATLITLQN